MSSRSTSTNANKTILRAKSSQVFVLEEIEEDLEERINHPTADRPPIYHLGRHPQGDIAVIDKPM